MKRADGSTACVSHADPPVGTYATISGQEETLPDPDALKGKNSHEDHQRILAAAVDRAVSLQTVCPCVPRSIGHRSRIRGVWEVCGAWRLVAGASDVRALWLRRLLRQVEEQARPRAFPPNWPSLDPALQRAGYGLGVVLRGRGASRPDMTEVFVAGAYFGSPRTGVLTRWQARRKSWALPIFDRSTPDPWAAGLPASSFAAASSSGDGGSAGSFDDGGPRPTAFRS
jgi:hypothetical protein